MKKILSIMLAGICSCASAENITISNTEIKAKDIPENGTIIAALYDDSSVLTGVRTYKGNESAKYSADMADELKSSKIIKVFVWDLEKIQPLGRAYEGNLSALPAEDTPAGGKELQMKIQDTVVSVDWEDNDSVKALKALCENKPLTIQMSMYGGFEQVGNIGTSLPRNDVQVTTKAGDIVLYSGSNIVVFYGTNSWAYTRLGHIIDKTDEELRELLSSGDVTITIRMD